MDMKFKNSGKKLAKKQIEEFEYEFEVKLPSDYKDFLMNSNGGIPDKVYYTENDADLVVNCFLSLGSEKYSLEEYFNDYKIVEEALPKELLPIGEDAFGNIILLSFESDSRGKVFLWLTEFDEIKFVANTFAELLNGLKKDI